MADATDLAMTQECIDYVKDEVLQTPWRGGLAATQVGYSPFVSNAEERSWRSLKQLFPNCCRIPMMTEQS